MPVFYGTSNVTNITTIPSFIKASDFRRPQELAKYLLYLEENPDEYAKYKLWRQAKQPFTTDYLGYLARNAPGPMETVHYKNFKRRQRTAACCRLCNTEFVKTAVLERRNMKEARYSHKLRKTEIERLYFGKYVRTNWTDDND